MDGRPYPSVLFRWTFTYKNIFMNFFLTNWGVLDNLCEVDVSNQDPWWIGKNRGRVHTGEHQRSHFLLARKRLCLWMDATHQ